VGEEKKRPVLKIAPPGIADLCLQQPITPKAFFACGSEVGHDILCYLPIPFSFSRIAAGANNTQHGRNK
jgi:hypothetical protein